MEEKQRGIIIVMMGGTVHHTCAEETLKQRLSQVIPVENVKWINDPSMDTDSIDIENKNYLPEAKTLNCSIEPGSLESLKESIFSISHRITLKVADFLGITDNFIDIIERFALSLDLQHERECYSASLDMQRTPLESLADVAMAFTINNDLEYTSYYDLYLRDKDKKIQRSYSAFHNAIYGSKFRQAKHSSKQIHCALKQNNRRTRNNGMIKNRIRNYNKPATL